MAKMIPSFFPQSEENKIANEEVIYNSLRDNLPDNYYVFYSVKSSYTQKKYNKYLGRDENIYRESEADFIVFNPDKKDCGIVVIEAKNITGFTIEDGKWKDYSGNYIHNGYGPYEQVKNYCNFLKNYISNNIDSISEILPITYIVWFQNIGIDKLKPTSNNINDADAKHTFSKQDLNNPYPKISELLKHCAVKDYNNKRDLTIKEIDKLRTCFLIKLNVFDAGGAKNVRDMEFKILLEEQIRILDFLEEQQVACIQGVGGTGKTVIAVQQAKKDSLDGKTLFLCYNSELNKYLNEKYKGEEIDFYSLDGFTNFAGKQLGIGNPKYSDTIKYIESEKFNYKHVVIDEAQDFGRDLGLNIDSKKIIDELFDTIRLKIEDAGGSMFVFFDKYQTIQSTFKLLPNIIINPECLLTLHTNCRNTKEISTTSLNPLKNVYECKNIRYSVKKGVSGKKPKFITIKNTCDLEKEINNIINKTNEQEFDKVVILSMKSIDKSIISDSEYFRQNTDGYSYMKDGKQYLVTTVRKFKGLEADSIILIDVDENTFKKGDDDNPNIDIMNFYVGCSRAKSELNILAQIDKNALQEILESDYGYGDATKPISILEQILECQN